MRVDEFTDGCTDCGNPHDQACPPECAANQDPPPLVPVFRRDDGTEVLVSGFAWTEAPNSHGVHVWRCGTDSDDPADLFVLRDGEAARWRALFEEVPDRPILRRAGPVLFLRLRDGLHLNLARMERFDPSPDHLGAREVGCEEGWVFDAFEMGEFEATQPEALAARGAPVLEALEVAGAQVRRIRWDVLPRFRLGDVVRLDWGDWRAVGVATLHDREHLDLVVRWLGP